ncbi:hypothetical protein NUW54_g9815 [Trametes sanguinea]|uniref:Uncharacterized protein n=1 Tax=Trametes sanguinea TaxID=158606 RepID=A0ACC1P4W6_9APHY|nr:hypothetical protein NUW54_g9815 [Trametes sanguinea]
MAPAGTEVAIELAAGAASESESAAGAEAPAASEQGFEHGPEATGAEPEIPLARLVAAGRMVAAAEAEHGTALATEAGAGFHGVAVLYGNTIDVNPSKHRVPARNAY